MGALFKAQSRGLVRLGVGRLRGSAHELRGQDMHLWLGANRWGKQAVASRFSLQVQHAIYRAKVQLGAMFV